MKILRARMNMRKKRRRRKRWEDHPSWLGGSGPGFFSGMIGDHWHSLDTDQSSSVSVRHDWSKKMVGARAQNKIYFTSSAIWGRLQNLIFLGVTFLHLTLMDKLEFTVVCKVQENIQFNWIIWIDDHLAWAFTNSRPPFRAPAPKLARIPWPTESWKANIYETVRTDHFTLQFNSIVFLLLSIAKGSFRVWYMTEK